jgi:hypothetical protein
VQPRHCETRIQIDCNLVLFNGSGPVTNPLSTQSEKVVGAAVEFIDLEQLMAHRFSAFELSAVCKQNRPQQ